MSANPEKADQDNVDQNQVMLQVCRKQSTGKKSMQIME